MIANFTVTQAEIEWLIENHIQSQFPLPIGSAIKVELSQTRDGRGGAVSYVANAEVTTPNRANATCLSRVINAEPTTGVSEKSIPTSGIAQQQAPMRIPQTPAEARAHLEAQYATEDAVDAASETMLSTDTVDAINEVTETRLADAGVSTSDDTSAAGEVIKNEVIVKPASLFKNLKRPVNA